ncbi:hypothetical protein D7W96_12370 [Salmonella enterica]|nr:hypothetical protein [Salmonella enterica]EBS0926354.1 hypothetical protein [Salmonella enterica subsp. enterica serovar Enteritidis]ECC9048884.1 hypothetical protein [Salmonella enterica subsp. enterica]ECR8498218.1 hypothetical protein [Salmonella enterica subsp. enterica serovar Typhimurium]ECS9031424.1 hypothetical protein [Salmonella enterica subsp. enterica serovar Java]HAC6851929.1 hypothetical protein [Salmonella enterica subsp. enterica serovar Dublin]
MRLSAGRPASQVDRVVIPEVLIGGINVIVDHTNYTNLRGCAGFFSNLFCYRSCYATRVICHNSSFSELSAKGS